MTLRVFDIAGRLVQILYNEQLALGPQSIMWDGRDDQGRMAPSGIYFYRLETGYYAETQRMLLIR